MFRLSIGPKDEFFLESSEPVSEIQLDFFENLYRRILTVREETIILSQAMDAANEDPED